MMNHPLCFTIQSLRNAPRTPLDVSFFTSDRKRVLFDHFLQDPDDVRKVPGGAPLSVELAGPRERIFFEPVQAKAAIVTCGGLCPGINDVIRAIVMELYHRYEVRNIVGIRYGFRGLIPQFGYP